MIKKIVISILVVVILLVGAVVAIPFIFKDEINAKIKAQINKELKADMDYTSYDLSIIKSFPDLYFTLDDLMIVGRNTFEGDTLANIKQVGFGLDLMKLIKKEGLELKSIHFEKPQLIAYSLQSTEGDTLSNYDILPDANEKEQTDTSSLIDINIEKLTIDEGKLYYKDFLSNTEIIIKNLKLDAKANYVENVADLITQITINELSYGTDDVNYLNKAKIDADINLDADLNNKIYTLKENEIGINALKLYADGEISLPSEDAIALDISFSADKSNFKELLSLIPAHYLKHYKDLEASGDFTFNGKAKGNISAGETPSFAVNLSIHNGRVQYPELPSAIENINLDASITNKSANLDNTDVSVPKARFSIAGEPIQLSLDAKHVLADPYVDLALKGKLPLEKIPDVYPIEGVKTLKGDIDADISFAGLLSSVEKKQYEQVDFTGNLTITDLQYATDSLPMAINAERVHLLFNPQYANFIATNTNVGKSDFNIDGKLENIINYVMSDGEVSGSINVQSKYINLDEILQQEDTEKTSKADASTTTEKTSTTKVPNNINLSTRLDAETIYYDGIEMKNTQGKLRIQDERVVLDNLSSNLMGGSAKISGSYDTKNTDKPKVHLAYDVSKFDIQETFNYFNTVKAIAPLSKYLNGQVSTNMTLNSVLNPDLSLDLAALSGVGKVSIPYAKFVEMPMLKKISDLTKVPFLKNPELKNAWTVLEFKDGRVNVEPFDVVMQDVLMRVEGSNGLDQTIDYNIKLTVPSDKFGGAASKANEFLSKQNIPLFNLSVPKSLTFHLNVSGLFTKPSVNIQKVTAEDSDKALQDQIKENIQNELDKAKEEAEKHAKEEAEKLRQQAEKEAEKAKQELEDKAREEVDKAKESVKDRIKEGLGGFGW